MAFTQSGMFDKGQILTDEKHSKEFLTHLVEEANAAEYLEKDSYKTKIVEVESVKKPQSSQLSQPDKASSKKTSKKQTKKRKS